MGGHGRRNVKRKRTSKEETGSASSSSSSEGVDHVDDQMKGNSSKKHQSPATMAAAHEEEVQPAGAEKKTNKEKRKRVVRDRLSEDLIGNKIVHTYLIYGMSDEMLAWCSKEELVEYAERKARTEKMQADDQALIDQYLINGYAESVLEVTDDEDD